jgi:Transposase, Mutator family
MAIVPGRGGWRKQARIGREQRRVQQQRVRGQIRQSVSGVVRAAIEEALQAEVTALLGRAKYRRRQTARWEAAEVRCRGCGQAWRPRLWRAGSYRRTLLTVDAAITLRVPRVACRCGRTVRWEFATLAPYERSWADLHERGRELAGLCVSLRDARTVLAWGNEQPVACSTLNGWVQDAAALAAALRAGPLDRIPPVVLLDGLWITLVEATDAWETDRQGRRRRRVQRQTVVLLVACGVDPVTGARGVLDWERAAREDEAGWRRLLERLQARGLHSTAGFTLFVHDGSSGLEAALGLVDFGPGVLRQRCVFHTIRTQWRNPGAASDRLLAAIA